MAPNSTQQAGVSEKHCTCCNLFNLSKGMIFFLVHLVIQITTKFTVFYDFVAFFLYQSVNPELCGIGLLRVENVIGWEQFIMICYLLHMNIWITRTSNIQQRPLYLLPCYSLRLHYTSSAAAACMGSKCKPVAMDNNNNLSNKGYN